jgi:actin-like ATPase involved in cell morphogenesis
LIRIIVPTEWTILEYEIDGDVVQVRLTDGVREIVIAAEVILTRRRAVLIDSIIQGAGRNTVGIALVRQLALWSKEKLDVDELRIESALRTSGATPGRRTRPLTF